MFTPEFYEKACIRLKELAGRQAEITADVQPCGDSELKEVVRSLPDGTIRVLVTGVIHCGKAMLINALAGRKEISREQTPSCNYALEFTGAKIEAYPLDDAREYLQKADAVVYCMNVQRCYCASDKMEIERLRDLGHRSIIFVNTFFDMLLNIDMMCETDDADKVRRHYTGILKELTDLGESGIFFVGSLPALTGKIKNKPELLKQSNFPPFEKRLEEILFNGKGKMKLLRSINEMRRINRRIECIINDRIDIASSDTADLANKIHIGRNNITLARAKADAISAKFSLATANLVEGAKTRFRSFLLDEILPNFEGWAQEYVPGEEREIRLTSPKTSIDAYTEGCSKFIQDYIETKIGEWTADLVKNYLNPNIVQIARSQQDNLDNYENDLRNNLLELNLSASGGNVSKGPESIVADFTAQEITGIAHFIVSRFNPVSIPFMVGAYVIASLVAGTISYPMFEDKVKEKVVNKMKEDIRKSLMEIENNIGQSVSEKINGINKAAKEGLEAPVKQCQDLLDEANATVNAQGDTLRKKIEVYNALRKHNSSLAENIDIIAESIGI